MHSDQSVEIIEIGETEPEQQARGQCFTDRFVLSLGIAHSEVLAVDIVAGYFLPFDNSVA